MADRKYTIVLDSDVRKDIEQVNAELHIVQSGIAVVMSSLRAQNADLDPDVVSVLEHYISSRLYQQTDRLEALLGPSQRPATESAERTSEDYSRVPV